MNVYESPFQNKRYQDGLLITLREGEWAGTKLNLPNYLHDQEKIIKGAHIALDIGELRQGVMDINALREDFSKIVSS